MTLYSIALIAALSTAGETPGASPQTGLLQDEAAYYASLDSRYVRDLGDLAVECMASNPALQDQISRRSDYVLVSRVEYNSASVEFLVLHGRYPKFSTYFASTCAGDQTETGDAAKLPWRLSRIRSKDLAVSHEPEYLITIVSSGVSARLHAFEPVNEDLSPRERAKARRILKLFKAVPFLNDR